VLPAIAEAGLACAGKDISQGGIIGTAVMLAECSAVGAIIDVLRIPRPDGVSLERWLQTFPSFGYLLAVPPPNVPDVLARFAARDIAAAEIGTITGGNRVEITDGRVTEIVWDFAQSPLIGCRTAEAIG
jgi:selenophosphate synthetase-related protein